MPDPIREGQRTRRPDNPSVSTARATPRQPSPEEVAERAMDDIERRRDSVSSLRARPRRPRRLGTPPLPVPDSPNEIGLYVRSFHFSKSFGGAFEGDDRGFAADPSASARIHAGAVLARGEEGFALDGPIGGHSDPSSHPVLGAARGRPTIWGSVEQVDERTSSLTLHYSGSVPLLPAAPAIDAHARFLVRDESPSELRVHVSVRGDAFPNAETLVRDAAGHTVILGVHALHIRQSPMTDLPGNERHRMIEADVSIRRDPDTGEFIGVRHNGRDHSLEEWNRLFEEARPQLGSAPLERVPRQPPPINSPLEP